jgi:pyruvate kinase
MMENLNGGGRAKIVWTVSPNTFDAPAAEVSERLTRYGVDGLLTVFSMDHIDKYKALRAQMADRASALAKGDVAFLFSLVGRRAFFFSTLEQSEIPRDSLVEISLICNRSACLQRKDPGQGSGVRVAVTCADMLEEMKPGVSLSFGYGEVEFELESISSRDSLSLTAQARVLVAGVLRSGMDVTSPAFRTGIFPLSSEDQEALRGPVFDLADVLIAQGVTAVEELRELRELLGERTRTQGAAQERTPPLLFLRVDSEKSLAMLDSAFAHIDGVFLNRSELGMSVHLHDLPFVQKDVIIRCNHLGKTVLVASDFFASMRKNSSPSRAEVSDLSNVILDGVDAVVLGREVTEAPQAEEAVRYCHETILSVENSLPAVWSEPSGLYERDLDALAAGALDAARCSGAKAIVCLTRRGFTAGRLSSLHPPIDVIALSYNERVRRQLRLMRGVRALCVEENLALDDLFSATRAKLSSVFGFRDGERIVFVSLSASTLGKRGSHLFLIEEFS